MTFDPAIYAFAVCSTELTRDGSQVMGMQLCSLDDDIKTRVADTEARRRRNIILDALREFNLHAVTILRNNPGLTAKAWVNESLRQADLAKLTAAEIKEYDP